MERTIFAIGGGQIAEGETFAIDREIVRRTGKRSPRFLFIPTASSDPIDYWKSVKRCYGKRLGCRTDALYLVRETPSFTEIREKIQRADIIYVGGGNTLMMMRLWRRLGVDRLLRAAYRRGAVMCGLSAGSICWFEFGHSDSMAFYNPRKWKYIKVRGLGLLPGIHCPHFDSHTLKLPRREHFRKMIRANGGRGIAIDDNCAIEYRNGVIHRVHRAKPNAGAFHVFRRKGAVLVEAIEDAR